MNTSFQRRPRAHRRFIIAGTAHLAAGEANIPGQLVTLGGGGMLVRTDVTPSSGSQVGIGFSVPGFPGNSPLKAVGTVVWTQPGKVGVKFNDIPPGLSSLLQWLESNNCPWSGVGE
jgi:hypothetical protein